MKMPINIVVDPSHFDTTGGTVVLPFPGPTGSTPPFTYKAPIQIAGFVPLYDCDDVECRPDYNICPYINTVFGFIDIAPVGKSTYENDMSTFYVDFMLGNADLNLQLQFSIEKMIANTWQFIANLTGNNRGIPYKFGSVPGHPSYAGYTVDWGRVLSLNGVGFYRIKVNTSAKETTSFTTKSFIWPGHSGTTTYPANMLITLSNSASSVFRLVGMTLNLQQLCDILNASSFALNNNLKFSQAAGVLYIESPASLTVSTIFVGDIVWTNTGSNTVTKSSSSLESCLVSEPFNLLAWNCNRAKGTVKFENNITGQIGDIKVDYLIHNFVGITYYDSIRLPGFFGFKTVPKYNEVLLEHGKPYTGKIERVRDEAVQQYEFHSFLAPQYIHDRLSVYGLMADKLIVSDYNINNSDFDIKQVNVVKVGAYSPEYYDDKSWLRKATVKALFAREVQGVIKTLCG